MRLHLVDRLVVAAVKCVPASDERAWLTEWRDAGPELWAVEPRPAPGGPGSGHTHVALSPDVGPTPTRTVAIRTDHWQRHGSSVVLDDEVDTTALIAAEVLCTDHARVAEWDAWYDDEHLPDMMDSGAFVAGTRWRRDPPRAGGANHLTVYEIAGMSLDEAVRRSAAIMPGLVESGRKHECHTGGLTLGLVRP